MHLLFDKIEAFESLSGSRPSLRPQELCSNDAVLFHSHPARDFCRPAAQKAQLP